MGYYLKEKIHLIGNDHIIRSFNMYAFATAVPYRHLIHPTPTLILFMTII